MVAITGSGVSGSNSAELLDGSIVAEAYGDALITERHRHRYEVNNAYRDVLTKAGLVISGTSPDGRLVEFVELDRERHPFFVATQAHPELKSRPTRAHPLFAAFVRAATTYSEADKLPVEIVGEPRPGAPAAPEARAPGRNSRPGRASAGADGRAGVADPRTAAPAS